MLIINSRGHYAPLYGQDTDNQLHRAGSAQQVAHHALGRTDRYTGGRVIKDLVNSPGLYLVPQGGRSGMGINIINGLGVTPGIGQGNVHGISGPPTTRLRGSHVASICTESVAQQLRIDRCPAPPGVSQFLQDYDASPLCQYETIPFLIKRSRGPLGFIISSREGLHIAEGRHC